MIIATVRTANNGGCGECACHCHSDEEHIPPGHIPACKFADPDYVSPDFRAAAEDAAKEMQSAIDSWRNYNRSGAS
jgi:hypothetical protein